MDSPSVTTSCILCSMVGKIADKIFWLGKLKSFLDSWGLWLWLVAFVAPAASAAWATWEWFTGAIPLWAAPIVFLALIGLMTFLVNQSLKIWLWLRTYRQDLPKLGEKLIQFGQKFAREVRDYDRNVPNPRLDRKSSPDDSHAQWAKSVEISENKSKWIAETFGGDLIYFVNSLHRIGVRPPFHLTASIEYGAMGLAAYFQYAGKMLQEGRLEELKASDQDRDWLNSTMFRN